MVSVEEEIEEMEAQNEDPFASLMKFLPQIDSLDSQIRNASFAREFEDFSDSQSQLYFSPVPPEIGTSEIVIVSLPDSDPSVEKGDPLFETPPENPLHHSSSEGQNEDDFGGKSKRVYSEIRLDDEDDDEREPKRRDFAQESVINHKEHLDSPVTVAGDEEEEEVEEERRFRLPMPMNPKGLTLLDILDDFKAYLAGKHGEVDEDNISLVETAKKQGMPFPRPRWWPPEHIFIDS